MNQPRILIAGVGNIFLGDDAFGVEVVQRLARRPLPDGVRGRFRHPRLRPDLRPVRRL
jgi:Ni,Fe-hydrogenase maturation factor